MYQIICTCKEKCRQLCIIFHSVNKMSETNYCIYLGHRLPTSFVHSYHLYVSTRLRQLTPNLVWLKEHLRKATLRKPLLNILLKRTFIEKEISLWWDASLLLSFTWQSILKASIVTDIQKLLNMNILHLKSVSYETYKMHHFNSLKNHSHDYTRRWYN